MLTKHARQFAIKEAISAIPIASQDELRMEMAKRKFRVTQATLSRDLRELGVGRVVTPDGARYVLQPEAEVQVLRPLVGTQVLSIVANENLIVVKTLPGCANIVGEFLDVQQSREIIGTVAGDNTLLVIPSSRKKTQKVLQFLREKLIEGR